MVGTQPPRKYLPSVNNHGLTVLTHRKVRMPASIKSHIKRILSPTWTDTLVDTTPNHRNKKVSIAQVGHHLFWGMLTGKRNLRDIETQSEIGGDRIADTTMTGLLERFSIGALPALISRQVKQASADKELRSSYLPYRNHLTFMPSRYFST